MFFMTTRLDKKKIAIVLAGIVVIVTALVLLLGGKEDASPTASASMSTNEGRIRFLEEFGWKVASSPKETTQVRIPAETSEVFERYNALQKSQGYDLSQYAGKTVMRYVYKITNYPGATDPVYATLLVYKRSGHRRRCDQHRRQGSHPRLQNAHRPGNTPNHTAHHTGKHLTDSQIAVYRSVHWLRNV